MIGIQPLPSEVVNLIAAGEVIDSLAAVVRELVENSLDAGATRIIVSVYPQQWRVRIADNGCGMDLLNLKAAATAHSTSKIRSCEDLWKISSLGFRGEALHSLAQLAELEILSRSAAGEGWCVKYNSQGQAAQVETVAIAPGTVVTVSNLFAAWAERRQGMPSVAQQIKAVQTTIVQVALCHPHVTWQVWQSDREWFTLCPGATTQHLLPQILRQVRLSDLQHLKVEIPTPSCEGVMGRWGDGAMGGQGENGRFIIDRSSSIVHPSFTSDIELYFDIEAQPELNLDYMLGVLVVDRSSKTETFHSLLAEKPEDEASIWEKFIEIVSQYPQAPIFHFFSYEVDTVIRLAKLYQTPTQTIQPLLDRFVDIYEYITQTVALPVESYALKAIARWLGFEWRDPQANGSQCIYWYDQWLATGDRTFLNSIQIYNEDDCRATRHVKDWLETFIQERGLVGTGVD